MTRWEKAGIRRRSCAACGAPPPSQVDHIIPWGKGGKDDASNWQPLCGPCNVEKSDRIVSLAELKRLAGERDGKYWARFFDWSSLVIVEAVEEADRG